MKDFVGIDKFSLLDYEGKLSIVLFSKDCNFRCPFCHNGDSVLKADTIIPFEEILAYLKTRVGLIDAVVITGGEPTLLEGLKEKIKMIKDLGFLIKLDSNGTHPEILKELIDEKLVDYIAMDIKNSLNKYDVTCGNPFVNLENIKKSISLLKENNVPYEFRTTLVNEYHNDESIKEIGELLNGSPRLFLQKFVDREGVIKKGLHEVDLNDANRFKSILEKYILKVELRGY